MTNPAPGKLVTQLHPAVQAFAEGIGGASPSTEVVEMAHRIALAAVDKTIEPDISVDVDGALSFDLRLANGLLLMAELSVGGTLDAGVVDDERGVIVEHLPNPTVEGLVRRF